MSRIGIKPVKIEEGVDVKIDNSVISVSGPKGSLSMKYRRPIKMKVEVGTVIVSRDSETKLTKSLHGLYRTLVQNMIEGVVRGYKKELEIKGIGYRAKMNGNDLEMSLGYSHLIVVTPPEGLSISVEDQTKIIVEGIDKQLVGQVAAKIKSRRKVEPYKGKGIRYVGEYVRRKSGKAAAVAA